MRMLNSGNRGYFDYYFKTLTSFRFSLYTTNVVKLYENYLQ